MRGGTVFFFCDIERRLWTGCSEVSPQDKHAFPVSRFLAKNRSPGTQSTLVIFFPLAFYITFFRVCRQEIVRGKGDGVTFSKEVKATKSTLVECQPALQLSMLGCVTQGSI